MHKLSLVVLDKESHRKSGIKRARKKWDKKTSPKVNRQISRDLQMKFKPKNVIYHNQLNVVF